MQAQVLILVSKVSNIITSAKVACNIHTWLTVYLILEGSEQMMEYQLVQAALIKVHCLVQHHREEK